MPIDPETVRRDLIAARYLELIEAGWYADARQLRAEHPELADAFAECIDGLIEEHADAA